MIRKWTAAAAASLLALAAGSAFANDAPPLRYLAFGEDAQSSSLNFDDEDSEFVAYRGGGYHGGGYHGGGYHGGGYRGGVGYYGGGYRGIGYGGYRGIGYYGGYRGIGYYGGYRPYYGHGGYYRPWVGFGLGYGLGYGVGYGSSYYSGYSGYYAPSYYYGYPGVAYADPCGGYPYAMPYAAPQVQGYQQQPPGYQPQPIPAPRGETIPAPQIPDQSNGFYRYNGDPIRLAPIPGLMPAPKAAPGPRPLITVSTQPTDNSETRFAYPAYGETGTTTFAADRAATPVRTAQKN